MAELHRSRPHPVLFAGNRPSARPADAPRLGALGLSVSAHAAVLLFLLLALGRGGSPNDAPGATARLPEGIVWIAQAGAGGGGGGGGNQRPEPPQVAQAQGSDRVTVPVAAASTDEQRELPTPTSRIDIPALATAAGLEDLPGIIGAIPFASISLGPGSGTGADDGTRGGTGSGDGDGLGDGRDRGTGGDVYEPGDGVSMPRVIYETKPNYTGEAMRAKVQGSVWMEAVVLPDGSLGAVRVTRSLDPQFGLDEEAVRTVRKWRFEPGRTRAGKPVAVRVIFEIAFRLR